MDNRIIKLKEQGLSGDGEFVLRIGPDEMQEVALRLMMLLWEITSTVVFSDGGRVIIKVLKVDDDVSNAQVESSHGSLVFFLGKNQVEYLLATLLRAIANGGVASASHIHIEGLKGGAPYDLTILFEHF
ncbi:hypothetical protein FRD01_03990 [Microvenator marinus]|uniref:Uncharacterized protein n=1 Tax=Microvenator marinus TaxID=2600177 RepID=A0A5B8XML9_9DELT|nr:hypothetical protein [Microvenator marinus]QED26421.1 hypothetical protein FRD01_03990 [Microvenator marinus]